MNKLRLSVDDLEVSSFETIIPSSGRGTVNAHRCTKDVYSCQMFCTRDCDIEPLTCAGEGGAGTCMCNAQTMEGCTYTTCTVG